MEAPLGPLPLAWVPPGVFSMGSPRNEAGRNKDENPVQVTLSQGFWLGQCPVTQAQWTEVMGTTIHDQAKQGTWGKDVFGEGPDWPMYYVCWREAKTFCQKLSDSEAQAGRLTVGWSYTLPTEAQWEFACRAGSTSKFAHGDDESGLADRAWYEVNSLGSSQRVHAKPPNAWGFYDLPGNVWNWCADGYASKLPGGTDPLVDPSSCSSRVARGGSWDLAARYCRSAHRGAFGPDDRSHQVGFRVALTKYP